MTDKGCNCGKPKPRPGASGGSKAPFALTTQGHTQTFGSRLERDAAWVRGGKVGDRRP